MIFLIRIYMKDTDKLNFFYACFYVCIPCIYSIDLIRKHILRIDDSQSPSESSSK